MIEKGLRRGNFKSRLLASKIGRNPYNTHKVLAEMINENKKDHDQSCPLSRRSSLHSLGTNTTASSSTIWHHHNKANGLPNKASSKPDNLHGLVRPPRQSSMGPPSNANVNIQANANWQAELDGPVRTQSRSSDGIASVPFAQDILKRAASSQQSFSDYIVAISSRRQSSLADERNGE